MAIESVRYLGHETQRALDALMLDRALMQVMDCDLAVGSEVKPMVRTFQFAHPTIIIGKGQKVEGRVDLEAAEREGVEVVERDTNGGHMFFSPHDFIYSIVAPRKMFEGTDVERIAMYNEFLVSALNSLGYEAEARRSSIALTNGFMGRLVAGTAGRSMHYALTHQAGVLVDPWSDEALDLLKATESEKQMLAERTIPLKHTGNDRYVRLSDAVRDALPNIEYSKPTQRELNSASDSVGLYQERESMGGVREQPICILSDLKRMEERVLEVAVV